MELSSGANSTGSNRIFDIQTKIRIGLMTGVKQSLVENYLRNLIYFALGVNSYSD
jgi:hypothetical protein